MKLQTETSCLLQDYYYFSIVAYIFYSEKSVFNFLIIISYSYLILKIRFCISEQPTEKEEIPQSTTIRFRVREKSMSFYVFIMKYFFYILWATFSYLKTCDEKVSNAKVFVFNELRLLFIFLCLCMCSDFLFNIFLCIYF